MMDVPFMTIRRSIVGLRSSSSSCLAGPSIYRWRPRRVGNNNPREESRVFLSSSSSSSSSSPPPSPFKSPSPLPPPKLEDANPERIRGIQVNPLSVGKDVLPGNLVYKTYKWSGRTRKVPLELSKGYFWMISDLRTTNQKPTLTNQSLIPSDEAQAFPTLSNIRLLSDPDIPISIPSFFTTTNEKNIKKAKTKKNDNKNKNRRQHIKKPKTITLVGLTFRDNGFKLLPSWIKPFEDEFTTHTGRRNAADSKIAGDDEVAVAVRSYTLSITERWILYPFRNMLTKAMRQNTPPGDHDKTMVCYTNGGGKSGSSSGSSSGQSLNELDDFRDVLRIHNLMTSYVFLLDSHGRVRFAGSGEATNDDVDLLKQSTYDLMNELK